MYPETNLNDWESKNETELARRLFGETFDTRGDHPSLYSVESYPDELCTATAYALTRGVSKDPKPFWAIRLFDWDLNELDIRIDDDEPGNTGVVEVDFRHFEIRNLSQEKAIGLTARVRKTACEGIDRFRYVAKWFQRLCMERFLSQPDEDVIAETKRRCRFGVGRETSADSKGRFRPQITRDLETHEPNVPRIRIERAAFLNYCGRVSNGILGSAESDWNNAEMRLRQAYKDAFR
jgi:hypothetical protein